jgi:uracil-DNA glycosylase
MSNTHSNFLKEMGITEWTTRDGSVSPSENTNAMINKVGVAEVPENQNDSLPRCHWWFFGDQPQGEAQILFQNIVRILGLSSAEWTWVKSSEKIGTLEVATEDVPIVAVAFGSLAVQKITGERDPLPQLRETVLAMSGVGNEEIPVLASFELAHFLARPKDKALLWQDLLLAKSVLFSI